MLMICNHADFVQRDITNEGLNDMRKDARKILTTYPIQVTIRLKTPSILEHQKPFIRENISTLVSSEMVPSFAVIVSSKKDCADSINTLVRNLEFDF